MSSSRRRCCAPSSRPQLPLRIIFRRRTSSDGVSTRHRLLAGMSVCDISTVPSSNLDEVVQHSRRLALRPPSCHLSANWEFFGVRSRKSALPQLLIQWQSLHVQYKMRSHKIRRKRMPSSTKLTRMKPLKDRGYFWIR
jgi:hypothetical protein